MQNLSYCIKQRSSRTKDHLSPCQPNPNPVFQGVFVAGLPGETNLGINFWWREEAAAARRTGDVVQCSTLQ